MGLICFYLIQRVITSILTFTLVMEKLRGNSASQGSRNLEVHGVESYLKALQVNNFDPAIRTSTNGVPYIVLKGQDEDGPFWVSLFFSKNTSKALGSTGSITKEQLFSCTIAEYEVQLSDGTWETRIKLSQQESTVDKFVPLF